MTMKMQMQKFWHDTAASGTWSGYYDGPADAKTYNFFTRRDTVSRLLEDEGDLPRVLDVGCGSGDYKEIADRHNGTFFGIDYAPAMIRKACERFPGQGESSLFLVGSGAELPYADDTFDVVMALGYIEYFTDPHAALAELQRVIKPGGLLVLQGYKKDLFGELDRFVFDPLRAVLRKIRGRTAQKAYLPPDWFDAKYNKGQLDALCKPHGFTAERWLFNNFHVFPAFLTVRWPERYIRWSEKLNYGNTDRWRWMAVNYIAKYRLNKPAAAGKAQSA